MGKPFKVDFMIIGAQKCGTSTLNKILRTHPSVVGCNKKEPHFFSLCKDWRTEISGYERMFRRSEGSVYFEASTSYTSYPHINFEIWDDMYAYNPDLKLIYLVRHPIERVSSGYMHMYERGYTDFGFEEALVKYPLLLDITRYYSQIKPFIRRFGQDQVRICFFEDLVHNPKMLVGDLAGFLGIDPEGFTNSDTIHLNQSVGKNKPHHKYSNPGLLLRTIRHFAPSVWRTITNNSARAFHERPMLSLPYQRMVLHMLNSEIDGLETLTGKDLNHWRVMSSVKVGQSDLKRYNEAICEGTT